MKSPPTPRPSATLILLREQHGQLEVLMTRRHERLAFMGGMWVFPGGTLHAADTAAESLQQVTAASRISPAKLVSLQGDALPAAECLGLAIAACREVFEETGILPAVTTATAQLPQHPTHVQAERADIARNPERFAAMLQREGWLLNLRDLIYWAHWITPSSAPRRFDTRFFATSVNPDTEFSADRTETVECRWMKPDELIDATASAHAPVSPPTLVTLLDLRNSYRRLGAIGTMLRAAANRNVPPILPKMLAEDFATQAVLPWDTDYAALPGEGIADVSCPQWLRGQPTRFMLRRQ